MKDPSLQSPAYNIYKDYNVSVIVPFYNEKWILRNLNILEDELGRFFKNYEIILVSDGSTELDIKKLIETQKNAPHIKVLHYKTNNGKGYALKHGYYHSKGDFIVFIDGGMELHPRDIKRFLVLIDIYKADIVIGSKRHPYSRVHYPLHRRILSFCYQIFIRIFLNLKQVKDTQVGLKLFRRQVLEDVLPRILVKKYAFDLEVLTVANHLGYVEILEAPVELNYFRNKTNKGILKDIIHTLKVTWPLLVDTLAIIYRLRVKKHYGRSSKKHVRAVSAVTDTLL